MRRRKTSRRWVWDYVREYARTQPHFVPRELSPRLTPEQARQACRGLMLRGELRLLQPGVSGAPGLAGLHFSPIYASPISLAARTTAAESPKSTNRAVGRIIPLGSTTAHSA